MSSEITLFIVDDDDVDALLLEREFKKNKISNSIVRARDGEQAMAMLKNGQIKEPFVILLDLKMPRMDGHEFLNDLREIEKHKDTVVFVLTTSQDHKDIALSYSKNIAGYFIKDQVGKEFKDIIELLGGYWKIVYLNHDKEEKI
ncbi:response regulator [Aliikangiella sp. IMCC44632]